jgi:hypothetical protein
MATVYLSDEPCFICGSKEGSVLMKRKERSVDLCLTHFRERLEPQPPKTSKKPKGEKK